jgi:hypothetical protein
MLLLARLVGGAVRVHHLVSWGSATRQSCHNFPLLGFLVGADHIICDVDIADEL